MPNQRHLLSDGIDPTEHHKFELLKNIDAGGLCRAFEECAVDSQCVVADVWKNTLSARSNGLNTLAMHLFSLSGNKDVPKLVEADVLKTQELIWTAEAETAACGFVKEYGSS